MFDNVDFRRFDKSTKVDGFTYDSSDDKDFEVSGQAPSMSAIGLNVSYNIKNYLAESIMLGGSLRSIPTRISSLRRNDARHMDAYNNSVVITILLTEVSTSPDAKRRITQTRKTEIRIPARMLNKGSVFVNELDCYIMLESQIDATRELIAKDVDHQNWDRINVPASMVRHDPEAMYVNHKDLVQSCLKRQDKIQIRVGVDLSYGRIPDHIKNMRISILDTYFVPLDSNKLVFDPTLNPDEFVVENLFKAANNSFQSTFTELNGRGVIYLDTSESETMFGKFYGMAVFKDKAVLADYVYKRRAVERFDEELLSVAERSGDPRLKEELERVKRDADVLQSQVDERDLQISSLSETLKKVRADLSEREKTIKNIVNHHDQSFSETVVIGGMENDRLKMQNEREKIENDRIDQEHREKTAPLTHKANMLKVVADIMKSGWGITTACLGGILSILALCKKYNVRLVMST